MIIYIENIAHPEWRDSYYDVVKVDQKVVSKEIIVVDMQLKDGTNIAKEFDGTQYKLSAIEG